MLSTIDTTAYLFDPQKNPTLLDHLSQIGKTSLFPEIIDQCIEGCTKDLPCVSALMQVPAKRSFVHDFVHMQGRQRMSITRKLREMNADFTIYKTERIPSWYNWVMSRLPWAVPARMFRSDPTGDHYYALTTVIRGLVCEALVHLQHQSLEIAD